MMTTLGTFCILLLLTAAAAAAIAQQDCPATCGSINIHYPFGIGRNCSREGFSLTCNQTYEPPKLFLGDGNIEVLNISWPEGAVLINSRIISNTSQDFNESWTSLPADGPFTLSSTNNQFTAIGCGVLAHFLFPGSQNFIAICASICSDEESFYGGASNTSWTSPDDALCSGVSCCRTAVPAGLRSFDVQLKSLNQTPNWAGGFANEAFVVEQEWFRKNVHMLKNSSGLGTVAPSAIPVVLDWALGNSTCEEAMNRSDFGCRSGNSTCVDCRVAGYRCNCSDGFDGNPYEVDGCKDIDECQQPKKYPCHGTCTNLPGTYSCVCPEGTSGNATEDKCFPNSKHFTLLPAVFIGIGSSVCLLSLLVGIALPVYQFKRRRVKKMKEKFFKQNRGLLLQQLISSNTDVAERMKIFKSEELEKATNNFDRTRILGLGGHGTVYKGILSDQRVVAIKKSKYIVQAEIDQFINEVVILSQINHRNVVKLYGCCLETEVPLLVYEFISNGALSDHLHEERLSLSWDDRLRIAVETSRALAYLHSSASISVFHRDVKSANVLLDDRFTAKISDFGASRSVACDQTGITTVIHGTYGYLDPEYHSTGRLTEKSDVYSFGVILVELLTRKKPAIRYSSRQEDRSLVAHFSHLLGEDRLFEILDPEVLEEGKSEEVRAVAALADMCLRFRGEERPSMKEVEVKLEALRGFKKQNTHPWIGERSEETQSLRRNPSEESSSADMTRQYSLEEEVMLSSTFPR